MKKFVFILLVGISLVGCGITTAQSSANDSPFGDDNPATVYTDRLTGCQYISYYQHGLTPRLDQSGKPICSKK